MMVAPRAEEESADQTRKVKGITTVVTPTVQSTSQEGDEVGRKGRMYKRRREEKQRRGKKVSYS